MNTLALIALFMGLSGIALILLGFLTGFIAFIIIGAIALPLAGVLAFIAAITFIIQILTS